MNLSNIGLIVGAGFSRPFGMPTTLSLTETLFNPKSKFGVFTDGRFFDEEDWNKIQKSEYLRERGFKEASKYSDLFKYIYTREKEKYNSYVFNYEDIYYYLDCLEHFGRNPVNDLYFQTLLDEIKTIDPEMHEEITFWSDQHFRKCKELITDIIYQSLHSKEDKNRSIPLLDALIEQSNLISIFSLNHDIIIEQYFHGKKLLYKDGFILDNNDVEIFQGEFTYDAGINLLKLHGSVNWYSTNDYSDVKRTTYFKRNSKGFELEGNGHYAHIKPKNKKQLSTVVNRKIFLTGTENKYRDYVTSLYSEMRFHFKGLMKKVDKLFIVGFSLNDYAVTAEVVNWKYANPEKPIYIVDPNIDYIKEQNILLDRIYKQFPDTVKLLAKNIENLELSELDLGF